MDAEPRSKAFKMRSMSSGCSLPKPTSI
jgi:hypothetical protein